MVCDPVLPLVVEVEGFELPDGELTLSVLIAPELLVTVCDKLLEGAILEDEFAVELPIVKIDGVLELAVLLVLDSEDT